MKRSLVPAALLSVLAAISGGSAYSADNFDDSQIKHIEYPDWFSENLFHDLSEDLGEKNNLAEANPGLVTKLNQRMEELDAEVESNARAPWRKE